jgi:hypothetical protein
MLTDVRVLATDTVRVCWRLFPQILSIYLLGWLAQQLTLKIAVIVGDVSAWAALAIFAFSFLSTLVAIVLILRLVGRELGIWDLMPAEESVADGRDASLTRMLAVTLLPFLGLYAAFGQVNEAAGGLATEQYYRNSVFGPASVLTVVRDLATDHPWRMVLILLVIYAVRRALDTAHERTDIRAFGLAVALLESFFILVVLFGGFVLFNRGKDWLGNRAFNGWIADLWRGFHHLLSLIHLQLPALFDRTFSFVLDEIWPVLWPVFSQPVIWLAVASLVFGSQVLSLAELWRKGQPIASRVPGASTFSRRADKLALRRIGTPPQGVARLASELKEVFLGDVDDKYLPTFHSLRLILRAGAIFLGSYVLLYTAIVVIQNAVTRLVHFLAGGRQVDFWYTNDPLINLLQNVPWELLRICLLAVAFRRCLEVFQARGQRQQDSSTAPAEPPETIAPSPVSA